MHIIWCQSASSPLRVAFQHAPRHAKTPTNAIAELESRNQCQVIEMSALTKPILWQYCAIINTHTHTHIQALTRRADESIFLFTGYLVCYAGVG